MIGLGKQRVEAGIKTNHQTIDGAVTSSRWGEFNRIGVTRGNTALDDFGAYNHDSIGYHCHAHTTTSTATSGSKTFTFTVRYLIKGAYAGAINSIPGCVVASQC